MLELMYKARGYGRNKMPAEIAKYNKEYGLCDEKQATREKK